MFGCLCFRQVFPDALQTGSQSFASAAIALCLSALASVPAGVTCASEFARCGCADGFAEQSIRFVCGESPYSLAESVQTALNMELHSPAQPTLPACTRLVVGASSRMFTPRNVIVTRA